jgi:hypothetical protein
MNYKIGHLQVILLCCCFILRNLIQIGTLDIYLSSSLWLLSRFTDAGRGEVRRASSKVETGPPLVDSGRVIWRVDGCGDSRLVKIPKLKYFLF